MKNKMICRNLFVLLRKLGSMSWPSICPCKLCRYAWCHYTRIESALSSTWSWHTNHQSATEIVPVVRLFCQYAIYCNQSAWFSSREQWQTHQGGWDTCQDKVNARPACCCRATVAAWRQVSKFHGLSSILIKNMLGFYSWPQCIRNRLGKRNIYSISFN